MRVLVTGASGFIGSWLTKELFHQGHEVTILTRGRTDLAAEIPFHHKAIGDVTDKASMVAAVQGMQAVFHLAGHIGYDPRERAMMELINVVGTQNVVDACIANKVERLIHMSSVVAVGAGFHPKQILNETSE
jgi:dihydroflavonol-4-reductase